MVITREMRAQAPQLRQHAAVHELGVADAVAGGEVAEADRAVGHDPADRLKAISKAGAEQPLLAGKTVREVAGTRGRPPVRIADIACGSGTFLLEVYQYLLDWYLAQYVAHLAPLLQAGHAATSSEVRALLPENEPAPAGKRASVPSPSTAIRPGGDRSK